ncbi:MAG: hypothetical protein AAGD38_20085 [Acidobacteriota bacterium]
MSRINVSLPLIIALSCLATGMALAQPEPPTPEEVWEMTREKGVVYEVTPEEVTVTADVEGVWVVRTSWDGQERTAIPIPPGQTRTFAVGDQLEVLGHIVSFPMDCHSDPARCATPKVIPPAAQNIPTNPGLQCVCPPDPCALDEDSACFTQCCTLSPPIPEPVDPPAPSGN